MKKLVELPLIEPLYSTYHGQGVTTAIIGNNKSIRNWHLNQTMNLSCSRKFLSGFTTPEINIVDSGWLSNPYFEKKWVSTEFTKGYINPIIRELLDNGFYVVFNDVDDYYIKGKSWYKERHFSHNGLICGYDQADKTFCIYAYDSNWIYQKFWTPQKGFYKGILSIKKEGTISSICGLKVKKDKIDFSPEIALRKIKEYLDSDLKKYPFDGEGNVYGIVVHEYIAEYITKLYSGDIPYARMDRRVFRLIWEHKKVMLERIKAIEKTLCISKKIGEQYESLVDEANTMRMLYAAHHMKRRDSVLPVIKKKLLKLMTKEQKILSVLVDEMEKELKNETVEISQK